MTGDWVLGSREENKIYTLQNDSLLIPSIRLRSHLSSLQEGGPISQVFEMVGYKRRFQTKSTGRIPYRLSQ